MIDPVMWISEWNWSENEVMIGVKMTSLLYED